MPRMGMGPDTERDMDMDMVLQIEGMSCRHCVASVKKALESVDGVEQASAELDTGLARVSGENLDPDALAEAVTRVGYAVVDVG